MSFKKFMTSKLTIAAIIFAIIYQFIMAIVYIPGYKHSADHIDRTRIALVNEDSGSTANKIKNKVADGIHYKSNSPKVKKYSKLSTAKNDLKNKRVLLVIDIPKNTSSKISHGEKFKVKYYDNKYDDEASSKIAAKVKDSVDNSLNNEFTKLGNTAVITKMMMKAQGSQIVKEKMTQAMQANPQLAQSPEAQQKLQKQVTNQVIAGMEQKAKHYVISDPVESDSQTISNNGSSNLAITIGTMLISLGCFISVMAASIMEFSQFENALIHGRSKLAAFGMYEAAFLVMSVLAPIFSILTFKLVTHIDNVAAIQMYGQNVLLTFVSAQFVSIFALMLGRVGLLINLPLALIQTLVAGAIMPYDLLPSVYRFFYHILPIPYNYMANMSIMSGVNKGYIFNYDIRLVVMGLIAGVISLGVAMVRKYHKKINENIS
ncbi:hypothetical protein BGL34_06715 [Fructilactobacillus lindneri]|uniref:DUF3533 domain-containing protein n=2 Tax=Fructilactobacillus lindneri TaxID=53444 RepID=A0A0R2JYU8_9LACO|nr:hypothetical protein [Fructilactobacillus lindneri]ANZ57630.1 hypothetical protein AYR60_02030 [Fructilactobacillus lindneri]ANZ58900.1 hypothetical protein AYR59_02030 [Fructilactobacillus lindneri]KRN79674.1 hypothetical protein IV52_GL000211 [Fructilactobacillus lindneri DSM 20690 = JCM 11027]POG97619.1 hypothetical protein BGL31_06690 [Fructilactobacillus lindneri]POH03414.1 hypothetical protein BGL32_06825 [Fructilactobacillus lindneri]